MALILLEFGKVQDFFVYDAEAGSEISDLGFHASGLRFE